jgi:hypothetical protein
MEFQSGWCSIETSKIVSSQEAPASSYVTFNNKGAGEALSTWSLQTDEQGKSQSDLILKMKFVFPEKQF